MTVHQLRPQSKRVASAPRRPSGGIRFREYLYGKFFAPGTEPLNELVRTPRDVYVAVMHAAHCAAELTPADARKRTDLIAWESLAWEVWGWAEDGTLTRDVARRIERTFALANYAHQDIVERWRKTGTEADGAKLETLGAFFCAARAAFNAHARRLAGNTPEGKH